MALLYELDAIADVTNNITMLSISCKNTNAFGYL